MRARARRLHQGDPFLGIYSLQPSFFFHKATFWILKNRSERMCLRHTMRAEPILRRHAQRLLGFWVFFFCGILLEPFFCFMPVNRMCVCVRMCGSWRRERSPALLCAQTDVPRFGEGVLHPKQKTPNLNESKRTISKLRNCWNKNIPPPPPFSPSPLLLNPLTLFVCVCVCVLVFSIPLLIVAGPNFCLGCVDAQRAWCGWLLR